MPNKTMVTIDGNTAAAYVAHATNEVIAIYPITPSSPMGEHADEYSAHGRKNIWGTVPDVIEMQSEAGAAGAVHGALTTGALTTTFTASQGLLLMIPNMFKIAGELTPTVFHIAARAVANQALSIFGDHSDVMATRSTGWAMLASNSIQEIMDFALIAQTATLDSRIPFLHFFDGFRTSHEIQKIEELPYEIMREMIPDEAVAAHRARALNPENPTIKGTSQNPDVFFAARESVNRYYLAVPGVVEAAMKKFAGLTGRTYSLFDYVGAPDAERVVVVMGSGAEVAEETVRFLVERGEKVGVVKVRLFKPFSVEHFMNTLPSTVDSVAVLDRTKEPGSLGEPLYEDVRTAIGEASDAGVNPFAHFPRIVGGRYGLGSNEFTPAMVKAVFDNLSADKPKNHFTVGINDDLTNTSLDYDSSFTTETEKVHRAMFFGLGSDGTVGANNNSIKIIGTATDNYAQGYFVYDSKKAGAMTVSHLRFGKDPIRSSYLIQNASFVACHKFSFLEKIDMLSCAEDGGVFLLASPFSKDEVWNHIPVEVQKQIIEKKLRFYVIDAHRLAREARMGTRINTIMQTAFFMISGVLPKDEALQLIKKAVVDTYGSKGQDIVERNMAAIELATSGIEQVDYPSEPVGELHMKPPVPADAPQFIREVTGEIIAGRGARIPVSKLPDDGTYPTGTTKYEKRNIADDVPEWEPDICIQCGDCSAVCPHAVIRMKAYDPTHLDGAPDTLRSAEAKGKEFAGLKFTIQISPEDCTGCRLCVYICPAHEKKDGEKTDKKALNMVSLLEVREREVGNWEYFETIPDTDPSLLRRNTTKGSQLLKPMFEFSGACAGCGETPYVKLLSQLFGDRAVIANATGCSSIYGGNLPTTPYAKRADGRGPSWSNSLFEDAAEFGMGMRLTADKLTAFARELVERMISGDAKGIDASLLEKIRDNEQSTPEEIERQRSYVADLKSQLESSDTAEAGRLLAVADYLIRRSVWVLGGDGWAYDIGYGGLDHVIASGRNVNILVMDTEVYSNTGGQMSKATPTGAIAKFAAGGKLLPKKDLGMMAMSYGYIYVARIAMGYNRIQTIRAFIEAEAFDGPSLIIAYSHCIPGHGIGAGAGLEQQKLAVESGVWPLFRFNPANIDKGKNPLSLDSKPPTIDVEDYIYNEIRFRSLRLAKPVTAEELLVNLRTQVKRQRTTYEYLAAREYSE